MTEVAYLYWIKTAEYTQPLSTTWINQNFSPFFAPKHILHKNVKFYKWQENTNHLPVHQSKYVPCGTQKHINGKEYLTCDAEMEKKVEKRWEGWSWMIVRDINNNDYVMVMVSHTAEGTHTHKRIYGHIYK